MRCTLGTQSRLLTRDAHGILRPIFPLRSAESLDSKSCETCREHPARRGWGTTGAIPPSHGGARSLCQIMDSSLVL